MRNIRILLKLFTICTCSLLLTQCVMQDYTPHPAYQRLLVKKERIGPYPKNKPVPSKHNINAPADNDADYFLRPVSDYTDAPTHRATPNHSYPYSDNDSSYYLPTDHYSEDNADHPPADVIYYDSYKNFYPQDNDADFVGTTGESEASGTEDYPLFFDD